MPEVDETFAKAFGVESGDVAQLRTDIRANMERELERKLRSMLKTNVMDALVTANAIDVPTAIVQQEAEALKKQTEVQTPGSALTIDAFMGDAKRRVQLGMILAEVAETSELNIDADMIKQRVEDMAKDYDDPDEFVNYYMGNQELLSGIQTLIMEDKVVDWIAEQASISTKNTNFDEVMNPEADNSK